jgi:riboflavin kinase/FMN adenylyltransferase
MAESLRIPAAGAMPPALRGAVVAIGNFDGVHRGHQAVLRKAREAAVRANRPAVLLTFEPHPRAVFRPDVPLFRLTPAPQKARIAGLLGFDAVVEQVFDKGFSAHTAEQFVTDVLVSSLGVSHVVTGFDFHFGKGREGGPAYMMEAGKRHGFEVSLVDAFRDENAQTISSSRIRALLAEQAVGEAAGLLGYRYLVSAQITRGKQLGRTLGYPTANMILPEDNDLAHGIYAVRFRRADGSIHDGVASFGRRPTVENDGSPVLETFVLDFEGDLYGEIATVSLVSFLRGEDKFGSLDKLVVQMKQDEAEARAALSAIAPLSPLDAQLTFANGNAL